MSPENPTLQIYLNEYERLKSEQVQRLGFRDNLIYANLIAMTGILSIAATDVVKVLVLLVLPLICTVLGWTYLVNDEKISAIGRYVRYTLSDKVRALIKSDEQGLFGWETAHRSDPRRISRKFMQLVVDELVFVLPGYIAIVMFWINAQVVLQSLRWVAILEAMVLLFLAIQIYIYADLHRGK
jgi:hypothetical protein